MIISFPDHTYYTNVLSSFLVYNGKVYHFDEFGTVKNTHLLANGIENACLSLIFVNLSVKADTCGKEEILGFL